MKLKIRKMAASLVIMAITASSAICVNAEAGYKLVIDGKDAGLSNPVVFADGYNLAPMAEILRILGAEVSWEPHTKTVTAKSEGKEISLTVGSLQAVVNGSVVDIDAAPRIIGGTTYVPIGFIARSLGYTVDWSAETKTIMLKPPGAAGAETDRLDVNFKDRYNMNLSYETAFNRAAAHSKDLKTLRNNMQDAEGQRSDLATSATSIGLTTENVPVTTFLELSDSIRSTLSTLDKLDTTLQGERYQTEIYEGTLAATVKGSFLAIAKAQNTIALTDAQIELSEMALNNSRLMLELGMISEVDFEKATVEHQKLVDGQRTNERALEIEYVTLNKLIGYDSNVRYNVVADNTYEPLINNFQLDNYVTSMMGVSPTIKLSQLSLEQAERNTKISLATTANELQQAKTAVNTASLSLEDTKSNYEKNIRNAYYSLRDLETQIATAELDLKKAKTDAGTARVKYETGEITKLELLQTLYAVDATEKGIELAKKSYNFSKFRFYNPYLL